MNTVISKDGTQCEGPRSSNGGVLCHPKKEKSHSERRAGGSSFTKAGVGHRPFLAIIADRLRC